MNANCGRMRNCYLSSMGKLVHSGGFRIYQTGGTPDMRQKSRLDFCQNLHENERNWTGKGRTPPAPLGSINGSDNQVRD